MCDKNVIMYIVEISIQLMMHLMQLHCLTTRGPNLYIP